MRKTLPIFLIVLDWIFFALFIVSIYFLIETNYSGLNIVPFVEYGSMVIVFFLLFYYFGKIRWAVEEKTHTGPESLVGKTGVVTKELNPQGEVRIEGIIWKARSSNGKNIDTGQIVVVKKIENISVVVEKINK